jgi:NAD(P)-dependent dehydrogenase (short-subunit alcohol dehydrogenase family)
VTPEQESILSSYRVDGKVAVVTGGSRGIGFGCAQALAEAGAEVVLVARAGPGLEEAAASVAGATFRACDVTDPAQVREAVGGLPRIDILVNSAGGNLPEPFLDVSEEHLQALIDLNLMGTFRVTQAAARVMAAGGGGCVVNISSDFGHVGFPGRSVYCLTKHGVEGLTKAVALELAPLGIRVNSVCPTFIETPLTRPYLADQEFYRQAVSRIPLGRIGQVNEVAAAVLFLASPASSLVTGASLLVDGGWTAQ